MTKLNVQKNKKRHLSLNWQEDLLSIAFNSAGSEHETFKRIERTAIALGFEYVAYGFQAPYPFSQQKITLLNNYPKSWQARYTQEKYLQIDPLVSYARQSQAPIIWSDQFFANAQNFWEDAKGHGLKVGWSQSTFDRYGSGGLVTLSRSGEPLSIRELEEKKLKMQWFVHAAHLALSRFFQINPVAQGENLSVRELEVLKWSADGKSAQDIADILNLSDNTVNFHIKNAINKLQAPNKTAAVARAVLGNLLVDVR
jgi:LuxR family transcriptional regulator